MSGALIDFVEARLDTMHGARIEMTVREEAPPPVSPNNIRKTIRSRHLPHELDAMPKMVAPKSNESFNDGFGWLEEFVDVEYELMKKRESMSLLLESTTDSSSITTCTVPAKHRGHHHRRSLSRRESLGLEIKDSADKNHRRSLSRRESILDGLDQDDDKSLLNEAALAD